MKYCLILSVFMLAFTAGFSQNIGINTVTPKATLHIISALKENLRLENTTALNVNVRNDLYFKTGSWFTGAIKTIGTNTAYARLGLFTYASSDTGGLLERISISDSGYVGIGTITPLETLDVAGTMKLADGTEGVGKVLTSDAAGNATWKNTAFGSLERFQYFIRKNQFNEILGSLYNFGTASAIGNIGNPKKITVYISKTGLYHFDWNSHSERPTATAGEGVVHSVFTTDEVLQNTTHYSLDPVNGTLTSYQNSLEIYIIAGQSIQFRSAYLTPGATDFYRLTVTGHLIAD